ncbi:effector-associated constant component EACC1 [Intrasporangium sp. YIM S08009]|uniref:effector-associated constant component EACC1 n=1 Tax=Intrasporangium zincisolvens TaxID=3080018 RepID=UPI002B060802|nr:hypothetical protein [Intrasporangium sp. YIM S08009]
MRATVVVALSEAGADGLRLDSLHRQLRTELGDLDEVEPLSSSGSAPVEAAPGSRAVDTATVSALAVAVFGSGGLTALVASLRGWLRRGTGDARSVRIEVGGDVFELTDASAEEQARLLQVFLQHVDGTEAPA